MTRASLGARVVTIVPDEKADDLVLTAQGFGLTLSQEQAKTLLMEAHYYERESHVYKNSPRPREIKKLLRTLSKHTDILVEALANPVAHPYLQRRTNCPDLDRFASDLNRFRDAALAAKERLPTDKGADDDQFLTNFILSARRVYEEAGGAGKGVYYRAEFDEYRGKFYRLVESTLQHVMSDRFGKSNSALGTKIVRTLKKKGKPLDI